MWTYNLLGLASLPGWFFLFLAWFQPGADLQPVWQVALFVLAAFVLHEALHVAAIRTVAPNASVSFGLRGANPYVRVEGDLSVGARFAFLLAPFVFISLLNWAIAVIDPAVAAACVIVATANAGGSTADLVRTRPLFPLIWGNLHGRPARGHIRTR